MARLTLVTRIISGAVGSLRLKTAASSTRPTSDRVKESVFSILESMDALEGSIVIDLFAGTGALGLEAASRGAESVSLIEKNPQAAKICQENLTLVETALNKSDLSPRLRLEKTAAEKYCKSERKASLVFIDPPYEFGNQKIEPLLDAFTNNSDCIFVIERSAKSEGLELTANFELLIKKSYGDTVVYFFTTGGAR